MKILVRLSNPETAPCTKYDAASQANPICFDYQYRSNSLLVNMTLGTIFGNSPKLGQCWGCQNQDFGDCMICSDYKKDDNLFDGLNPCGLHHNSYYSYSCEKDDLSQTEFEDGRTNFEYRQEICGNAPMPDNTNIIIKGFEDKSVKLFYFGCNIYATEKYVDKMINSLTTKTMPGKFSSKTNL